MQEFESLDLDQLLALESSETLLITVNNRYARRLLAQLSVRVDRAQGSLAIPAIMPLSAWLRQISDVLCFVPNFVPASHELDAFTSRQLWQQVITECEEEGYLLNIPQAARSAVEADYLLDEWKIQVLEAEHTADYEHFLQWRLAYRDALVRLDLDDSNTSIERIVAALETGAFVPDCRNLVLMGFHEYSPRLRAMLLAAQKQGVQLYQFQVQEPEANHVYCHAAFDTEQEWRQAVQWAREHLDADPKCHVAIVAPSLETQVPLVHRLMHQALSVEGRLIHNYNVAAARPLAQWPYARSALAWMKALAVLSTQGIAEPELLAQALLQGLCAGGQAEAGGRAAIDVGWRQQQELGVSAARFQQALNEHAPLLARAWEQAYELMRQAPKQQDCLAWAHHWRQALDLLGFPGSEAVDSAGYQTLEALQQAVQQLAAQAPALGALTVMAFQHLFATKLQDMPFQPQRAANARLDVLGFLEAEGGRWDAVWVVGLSDAVLPAVVRPNALLPAVALRRANAPRATPERELAWARLIMQSLLRSADTVWLSYPQTEGEQQLRPSPLIAHHERRQYLMRQMNEMDAAKVEMEYFDDHLGPALTANEPISGGVAVLEAQARNPLWAFVRYRLHARELAVYATLADMNSRGLFLHNLLERLWDELPDQQSLQHAFAQGHLDVLVQHALEHAAQQELAHYSERLQALEVQRARLITDAYVQLELSRPCFSIAQREQQHEWRYEALRLRMRLDRLDRLPEGDVILIDYKTGSGDFRLKQEWLRERPINLQLPFYAMLLQDAGLDVVALALCRLHARSVEYAGMGQEDLDFPGLQELPPEQSWSALLQAWRVAIHSLAREFVTGNAINQTATPNDLLYCDVLPFLRLYDEQEEQHEAAQ